MDFLHHPLLLFRPEGIRALVQAFGLPFVCAIVFVESGVFPMLPGDSLLVVCGIFAAAPSAAAGASLAPVLLFTLVPLCSILGAQIGYGVGRRFGPAVHGWPDRRWGVVPLYRHAWLEHTERFFGRWGAFAVVAGRWVPFVRTGTPLLAGMTGMRAWTFLCYNLLGAVGWVWSMLLMGMFLPPLVARIWPGYRLEDHIDALAVGVVLVSLLPVGYTILRERGARAPKA